MRFTTALLTLTASLLACNALVGVTDVTLGDPTIAGDDATTDGASEGDGSVIDGSFVDAQGTDAAPQAVGGIAVGATHACATTPAATVKCWGGNSSGQTGGALPFDAGDTAIVASPRLVSGLSGVVSLASGYDFSCAVSAGGVWCWGNNYVGQLGDGTKNKNSTPVRVVGIADAVSVRAGASFACAVRKGGQVSCWGNNFNGQLGNDTKTSSSIPVAVKGLTDIVAVSAGSSHACALRKGGSVTCWGDNGYGQLGRSETTTQSSVPLDVIGPENIVAVRTMSSTTCELQASGKVFCFGYNGYGDLGTGTSDFVVNAVATQVPGLENAAGIEVGNHHGCALKQTGEIVCWGDNYLGQAGVSNLDGGREEIKVGGAIDIGAGLFLGAGGNTSCAQTKDSVVHCWGNNVYGQLGNGMTTNSFVPVIVSAFP